MLDKCENLKNLEIISAQPKTLYVLCFAEIGERFGFYIMRGLLVLYLTKVLLFSNHQSYVIFANFSALLYLSPMLGGYFADTVLGTKKATLLGGGFLVIGYTLLAIPSCHYLYIALSAIIIGSGFFTPNIANSVGQLYHADDSRRTSGFSIFYVAINIGALIPSLIIAFIINKFGWHVGFMLAAVGTLIGTFIFYLGFTEHKKENFYVVKKKYHYLTIFICAILSIPFFSFLIKERFYANTIIFCIGAFFLFYAFKKSLQFPRKQQQRMLACALLILCSIIFEMLLQQSAMSLTLFAEYNVKREIGFLTVPTVMLQSLNPFFIICCGPVLAKFWIWLDKKGFNPSIAAKFSSGTLLMGISYVMLSYAINNSSGGIISLNWIISSYFLQSCGELLVSPVGLSMVTESSPKEMAGLMMGIWYFAISIAQALAGVVSTWTISISGTNEPVLTAGIYSNTFVMLGMLSIVASFIIFFMIPLSKKVI